MFQPEEALRGRLRQVKESVLGGGGGAAWGQVLHWGLEGKGQSSAPPFLPVA